MGLIPGRGTKIPYVAGQLSWYIIPAAMCCNKDPISQKKKKKNPEEKAFLSSWEMKIMILFLPNFIGLLRESNMINDYFENLEP